MQLLDSTKQNITIKLAKQGNEWAFKTLVKRFEGDVFRFAYSILGNAEDCQDVSQEVFLKVYFALDKYEKREAKFTTWLFVITRNECLNHLKKNEHKKTQLDEKLDEKLAEASFENEVALKNDLYLYLRSLPLATKEAFVLVALQGFTYEEAGHILKVSPGTVKSRVHNGRMKLLKKMELNRDKEMSLSEM